MKYTMMVTLVTAVLMTGCGTDGKDGTDGRDGIDGSDSLTSLIATAPANSNICPNGGFKYMTGLDDNNNGILDEGEIRNTVNVCNGSDGVDGTNGLTSLTETFPVAPGAECTNGGFKYVSGLDVNDNGVLDINEVKNTSYVCNGVDGQDGTDSSGGSGYQECPVVTDPTNVQRMCVNQLNDGNWLLEVKNNSDDTISQLLVCNALKFYVVSGDWLGLPQDSTGSTKIYHYDSNGYSHSSMTFGSTNITDILNHQLIVGLKLIKSTSSFNPPSAVLTHIEHNPMGLECPVQ